MMRISCGRAGMTSFLPRYEQKAARMKREWDAGQAAAQAREAAEKAAAPEKCRAAKASVEKYYAADLESHEKLLSEADLYDTETFTSKYLSSGPNLPDTRNEFHHYCRYDDAAHQWELGILARYKELGNQFNALRDAKQRKIASAPAAPPRIAKPSTQPVLQHPVSCSDITGTGSSAPAIANCKTGDTALAAATRLRQQNPAAARVKYQEASDAYRRAGDHRKANAMLKEAEVIIAALNPAPPPVGPQAPSRPPANASGASQMPPTAPPPAGPQANGAPNATPYADPNPNAIHWHHTSDPADCANANSVEHSSAEWGYMCVPDANGLTGDAAAQAAKAAAQSGSTTNIVCPTGAPGQTDSDCHPLTSAITFGELNAQALAACPNPDLDARRTCIADAKLFILLGYDPTVRARCIAVADHRKQLACANMVYLYGPTASATDDLRERMRAMLRPSAAVANLPDWVTTPPAPPEVPRDQVPNPCPPGQGGQPVPGGFGKWACLALPSFVLLQDKPDAPSVPGADASAEAPESIPQFENAAKDVAALIATAVAPRAGARLAEKDRTMCTTVAGAAVLAMMKGGRASVPPICLRVVAAARAEFGSLARNGFYSGSRGLDTMLAVLGTYYQNARDAFGADLGAPQPGMTGLKPLAQDQQSQRASDCVSAETHWKSIEAMRDLEQSLRVAAYQDHLTRFGQCAFAALAQARIDQLRKQP
jgi:hypothetical protein